MTDYEKLLPLAAALSDEDRERLAEELRRPSLADRQRARCKLLREYRARWHAEISDRAAAVEIEKALTRLAASGFHHRVAPVIPDQRRAELFEILTAGPVLGAERIRQILRG